MTIVRTTEGVQGSEPEVATALDELAREGARRMILAALEVEVEEYRQQHRDARDRRGHALVVRNGPGRPRPQPCLPGIGPARHHPRESEIVGAGLSLERAISKDGPKHHPLSQQPHKPCRGR